MTSLHYLGPFCRTWKWTGRDSERDVIRNNSYTLKALLSQCSTLAQSADSSALKRRSTMLPVEVTLIDKAYVRPFRSAGTVPVGGGKVGYFRERKGW